MKDKAKVIEEEKIFYSVTMTQSDLAKDDNKFFIIQALQVGEEPREDYYLFTRWGRVGVPGQNKCNECPTKKEVIRQYNVKSQEKVKRSGYKVVEVTYEQGDLDMDDDLVSTYIGHTRLNEKVQELVRLIFDRKMMQFNMK
jgi:poly [ADP-ribose] polymerase 2/3/4